MDDAVAAKLPLPNIDILHDYAHRAFAAVEQVFNAIEDRQLPIRRPDLCYAGYVERERTVCGAILSHLSHSSRHLGMIEALRGILLHKRGSMTF